MTNKQSMKRPLKLGLLAGCILLAAGLLVALVVNHVYAANKIDYWPTAGWKTSTPEAQGMDSAKLAGVFAAAKDQGLDSMLVIRNGYLVTEAYTHDMDKDTKQNMLSVTKSFISALFGIEMADKGGISPEDPVAKYFPQMDLLDPDPRKNQMVIGHLLTMTSGMKWSNDEEASSQALMASDNWVNYILGTGMDAVPGTSFYYSNANPHLVSAILQKFTGSTAEQIAKDKLFAPLGITDYVWDKDPQGISNGAWGLHLTSRDMAKFGLLYLQDGKWDGKTVVPKDWVKTSTKEYVAETEKDGTQRGYGYLWWLRNSQDRPKEANKDYDMYSAVGFAGQRIVVIPKQQLVLVFTGNNQQDSFFADKLIDNYIVPAVKSDKPLKDNPSAFKQLTDNIAAFKNQPTL